jgi:hypothetical protein
MRGAGEARDSSQATEPRFARFSHPALRAIRLHALTPPREKRRRMTESFRPTAALIGHWSWLSGHSKG